MSSLLDFNDKVYTGLFCLARDIQLTCDLDELAASNVLRSLNNGLDQLAKGIGKAEVYNAVYHCESMVYRGQPKMLISISEPNRAMSTVDKSVVLDFTIHPMHGLFVNGMPTNNSIIANESRQMSLNL